ncbi:MAG: DUF1735 and LamG domain-containing protein [Bacteroidales bacterium]|nr:DUF1735 and LamG domain-containing protein [Bacteroidales bacterium]
MKKIFAISLFVALFASCTVHDDAQRFDNKVFFTGDVRLSDVRVGEEDASLSRSFAVSMASPMDVPVTVNLRVDGSLVSRYADTYGDKGAKLLPSANYSLESTTLTIPAGGVQSSAAKISFTGANALPDLKTHYVLPLVLDCDTPGALESGRTIYYVLSKASLVNVVADMYDNRAWPSWKDPAPFKDMATFTLEALVNATTFKREDDKGNKIASPLATIMGIEDRFLIRVGDTLIPDNQIQIAFAEKDGEGSTKRGHISNAAMQLKPGVWYHIAVTFDHGAIKCYVNGRMLGEGNTLDNTNVTTVDFSTEHSEEDDGKPRCFWVGYSYDKWRYWNGRICECRIWNRALSEAEINADKHFYQVDPSSAGLIAYWKFDEGSGTVIKDHSPLGNDLEVQKPITWYPVSLPEE